MAMEAATPGPAVPHAVPLARVRALPLTLALGGLVGVSFALRLAAALAHATPLYFPDEYIYGTIARSIATTGKPAVRGIPAHFPALLEPPLAAPFWLTHGPELASRAPPGPSSLPMPLGAALRWAATDTMMLAYSAGWILVPGALVGLAYALVRPRVRVERAFGAFVVFLALLLFLEAAVYAARGSTRYQERYLFTLL